MGPLLGMRSMNHFTKTVKSYHYGRCLGFVRESLDVVCLRHLLKNPGGGVDLA